MEAKNQVLTPENIRIVNARYPKTRIKNLQYREKRLVVHYSRENGFDIHMNFDIPDNQSFILSKLPGVEHCFHNGRYTLTVFASKAFDVNDVFRKVASELVGVNIEQFMIQS